VTVKVENTNVFVHWYCLLAFAQADY